MSIDLKESVMIRLTCKIASLSSSLDKIKSMVKLNAKSDRSSMKISNHSPV